MVHTKNKYNRQACDGTPGKATLDVQHEVQNCPMKINCLSTLGLTSCVVLSRWHSTGDVWLQRMSVCVFTCSRSVGLNLQAWILLLTLMHVRECSIKRASVLFVRCNMLISMAASLAWRPPPPTAAAVVSGGVLLPDWVDFRLLYRSGQAWTRAVDSAFVPQVVAESSNGGLLPSLLMQTVGCPKSEMLQVKEGIRKCFSNNIFYSSFLISRKRSLYDIRLYSLFWIPQNAAIHKETCRRYIITLDPSIYCVLERTTFISS